MVTIDPPLDLSLVAVIGDNIPTRDAFGLHVGHFITPDSATVGKITWGDHVSVPRLPRRSGLEQTL
jgi:hypothetical protein